MAAADAEGQLDNPIWFCLRAGTRTSRKASSAGNVALLSNR